MFKQRKVLSSILVVAMVALLITSLTSTPTNAWWIFGEDSQEESQVKTKQTNKQPKYVFLFIGDGMAASQRQLASYFLKAKTGNQDAQLTMNKLPVGGMNTTYASNTLVTDSAAAGTALATGYKTNKGMIGQLPNGTSVRTIIEAAEAKGMGTGVISTMRLTHATPASFLAHNESRYNPNQIAEDIAQSNVDFLAGGGYRHFIPKTAKKSERKDNKNLVKVFKDKDYKTFVGDPQGFRAYKPKKGDKVFAPLTASHLPYELDRNPNTTPSLAEITQKGINTLVKHDNGFVMMVEGGRIDYAGHANSPATVANDVLAFDKAVQKAYRFYKKHPKETLIVVTGDHETGGLGLGFKNNYFLNIDKLLPIKSSLDQLNYTGDRKAFFTSLKKDYGLTNLTAKEKAKIEKAMNLADAGKKLVNYMPGWMSPVNAMVAKIVSARAGLFWTTYAHTGTAVPLTAAGVGANNFSGYKDNTQVAKEMANLLDLKLTNLK
ncbi:Alkaline phosphatase [Halobacteroides halobius DSM 5150]|uniref:Alkaline phosphatase n=1 Tax=Halobacteroides halobius (strain ATCC 35273 / DSM 5150 / MD-1) TaxID=748449 RepID=L0K7H4_HALHC|nr:alkaline phosphatase [Halobacteroides halobius]AGB40078.1 Alkaline phosphatase [Halobacteroides halobius DSM 5150]